jgi:hypothetical protein
MAKKEPRQLSLFSNIQNFQLTIDRTLTKRILGANGIMYEFVLPYGANPNRYWEDAVDVRSIKGNNKRPSTAKGREGIVYGPGQYQPIGDKRYFNFYQLRKMKSSGDWESFVDDMVRRKQLALADFYKKKILEEIDKYERK